MVQSPLREDAKWENTGLRAGEAETEKVKKAGCKETHCLPGSVVTRPDKGHTQGFLEGCLGKEAAPFGKDLPCDPQTPVHANLHFNNLEIKDSL